MELRSSNTSSSDEIGSEAPTRPYDTEKKHLKHRAEIVQGKLKQMGMKNVQGLSAEDLNNKSARPVWSKKGGDHEDETPVNFKKRKDEGGNVSRKRKRLVVDESHHKDSDLQGSEDDGEDVMGNDSPPKKAVSDSKFNRERSGKKANRSYSNDVVKSESKDALKKPKRTGEDGVSQIVYFDCSLLF